MVGGAGVNKSGRFPDFTRFSIFLERLKHNASFILLSGSIKDWPGYVCRGKTYICYCKENDFADLVYMN